MGYSKLAEKVYRAGSSVTIPGYSTYNTRVYTAGSPVTRTTYVESSDYYESDGAAVMYYGDGSYVTGRGSAISGTNQGVATSTTYYYSNPTYGTSYGKMTKTSTSLYLGGSGYSAYAGNGSAGYLRGSSKACYFRKSVAASGVFVKGSSTTVTPIGTCVNPPGATQLYTRDTSKDTTVTALGTEFKNVYERDEDSDFEVTPILRERSGLFERSEDYTTVKIVGEECTLELAKVTTQKSIVLGRPGGGPVLTE